MLPMGSQLHNQENDYAPFLQRTWKYKFSKVAYMSPDLN